jgi:hypothetical protein
MIKDISRVMIFNFPFVVVVLGTMYALVGSHAERSKTAFQIMGLGGGLVFIGVFLRGLCFCMIVGVSFLEGIYLQITISKICFIEFVGVVLLFPNLSLGKWVSYGVYITFKADYSWISFP